MRSNEYESKKTLTETPHVNPCIEAIRHEL